MVWCRQKKGDSRVPDLRHGPWTRPLWSCVWQGQVCEDVKLALSQALMGVCKTSTQVLSSPNSTHSFLAVLIWPLSTNRSMRLQIAKSSYSLSQAAFLWRSAKCLFPLQWLHLSYFICTYNTARFPLPGSPVAAQQGGSDSALLNLEQGRVLIITWASPVLSCSML